MPQQKFKGYLMVFLSSIGFGSYAIWSRITDQYFGIFFVAWVRSLIVLILLILLGIYTKSFKRISRSDLKWICVPILFGIATQAPIYYAFNHLDISTAILIFYSSYLIFSYLIGYFLLKEKMSIPKIISLVLSFIGLLFIFGVSFSKFSILAAILALVNGVASGGEVAMTKKVSKRVSSIQVSTFLWLGILITHLPISLLSHELQMTFSFSVPWIALICFAVVGLVSFLLVVEGYKHVDASIGSLIGLTEVVFAAIFGIFIYHESPSIAVLLGGVIIIFAAAFPDLVILFRKKG